MTKFVARTKMLLGKNKTAVLYKDNCKNSPVYCIDVCIGQTIISTNSYPTEISALKSFHEMV
jgi:hypothetical protein